MQVLRGTREALLEAAVQVRVWSAGGRHEGHSRLEVGPEEHSTWEVGARGAQHLGGGARGAQQLRGGGHEEHSRWELDWAYPSGFSCSLLLMQEGPWGTQPGHSVQSQAQ